MPSKSREPNDPALSPRRGLQHRGGLLQTLGLDYRAAILAVLVDFLAFSSDIVSMGLLYPVELGGAAVLFFVQQNAAALLK